MMPFPQFEQQANAIPYRYRHPFMLYALIRWLRPQSVVEVGTHIGASAVWMARALQENGESMPCRCDNSGEPWCFHCSPGILTCIDNFCWREEPNQERDWHANVVACGVRFSIELIKGRSQEVTWPPKVDFAYIDGNHTFEVARHDTLKAMEHGARCVCLNDGSTCAGVRRLIHDIRYNEGCQWNRYGPLDFLEVPFDAGLFIAMKREPYPDGPVQDDYDQWDV